MAIYFHGTTKKGLEDILAGLSKSSGPWTCSDRDGYTYLWDAERMLESGEVSEIKEAVSRAFESAQVQAAILGEDTELYVLELEFDPSDVEMDLSCEGMESTCSCVREDAVTHERISKVYRRTFSKWDAPFVLAGLIGRDQFSEDNVADGQLLIIAKTLKEHMLYLDEEPDWEELVPEELGIASGRSLAPFPA